MVTASDLGMTSEEFEGAMNVERMFSIAASSECALCGKKPVEYADRTNYELLCSSCGKEHGAKKISDTSFRTEDINKFEDYILQDKPKKQSQKAKPRKEKPKKKKRPPTSSESLSEPSYSSSESSIPPPRRRSKNKQKKMSPNNTGKKKLSYDPPSVYGGVSQPGMGGLYNNARNMGPGMAPHMRPQAVTQQQWAPQMQGQQMNRNTVMPINNIPVQSNMPRMQPYTYPGMGNNSMMPMPYNDPRMMGKNGQMAAVRHEPNIPEAHQYKNVNMINPMNNMMAIQGQYGMGIPMTNDMGIQSRSMQSGNNPFSTMGTAGNPTGNPFLARVRNKNSQQQRQYPQNGGYQTNVQDQQFPNMYNF